MKRGLSFIVEIILLLILFMIYFNQLFPSVSLPEYYNEIVDILYLDSLAYSLIDQKIKQILDHFDVDLIYITFKQVLSSRFSRFYIRLHYYEPVFVKGDGDCILFMYPLPYESSSIDLKIFGWDGIQCTNLSYSKDWYMFIVHGLDDSLSNQNISIDISEYPTLDPYSLFLFDIDGNPLKINAMALDSSFLNLSIESLYNREVIIMGRVKNNIIEQNLTYLAGRYPIVSKIKNAVNVQFVMTHSSWITLAIDKNCYSRGRLLIKISYPEKGMIVNKNYNMIMCNSAQMVYYSTINFFRPFVDILKVQGMHKASYKYGSSITFPGLIYNTIDIYVA